MFDFQHIVYNLITAFFNLLGLIPRKWAFRLGNALGRIWFAVDKKHRKIAIDNLTRAFGNEKKASEIKTLAERVFNNLGQILLEIGWSLRLDEKKRSKYFRIEGISHVKHAYKKGKGILVLTGHMGNWELLTVAASIIGYPLSIVVRPLDFKPLDLYFINIRTRYGGKLIPAKYSLRAILRSLNRGEAIGLLMDQSANWREGIFSEFFGIQTWTNKGLALLALKTEAPVIPVFLIREKFGFTIKILPEVPLIKTGDKRKDVEANTQQYNKIIESIIRQYPDQWFWVHRRWKKNYQLWHKRVDNKKRQNNELKKKNK